MNRAFTKYDPGNVVKLFCITWFIMKLICYKLWLANRLFPLVPVNDSLLVLPSNIHTSLFAVSLGLMLLLIIRPGKKIAAVLLLAELISCILDQNRWQPWEYQFIFMLSVYIFYNDEKQNRNALQLILAAIFFFSGVSKLNSAFIHDIWQNLMLRRWLGFFPVNIWITRAGYALPLIEMAAGIGLLLNKTRRPAIWVLTAMHVMILLMLGPAGLNKNEVVWPWNVLMPLLLFYLFYKGTFQFSDTRLQKPFSLLILLCWWILPWFQLAGYWDKYLSAVLYGGGVEQLFICSEDPVAKKEMAVYMDNEFKIIPCNPSLSVYKWGMMEMKTAPYPENRIYDAIILAWKKKYPGSTNRFYLFKSGFGPSVREVGK